MAEATDDSDTNRKGGSLHALVMRCCPFCNRPADIVGEYGDKQWKAGCKLCGYWLKPWRVKRDAVHVWNMRPEADERIEEAHNVKGQLAGSGETNANEANDNL